MVDKPTDMRGVKLRLNRKRLYLIVEPYVLGRQSIKWYAKTFRLKPEVVLKYVLKNRAAVMDLHGDIFGIDVDYPGHDQARRDLLSRAYNENLHDHGSKQWIDYEFYDWEFYLERNKYIVLPYSDKFRRVLRERKREKRIKTVTPTFEALERQLREIRLVVIDLNLQIGLFKNLVEKSAKDIAILEALDGLLGVLTSKKGAKKLPIDSSDLAGVKNLHKNLRNLKEKAYKHMMHNPPDVKCQKKLRERAKYAKKLMKLIVDPKLIKNTNTLMNNLDIAPRELEPTTLKTLRQAAQALLISPEADGFVVNHVIPVIEIVSNQPFDTKELKAPKHPAFEQAVKNPPDTPSTSMASSIFVTKSVFEIVAEHYAIASKIAGNTPGPASFFESLIELTAPWIMEKIIKSRQRVGLSARWAARLYRYLVNSADLNLEQRVALIDAIDNGNLGKKGLRKFQRRHDWSNNCLPHFLRALQAIGASACFIVAITADDANTLMGWARIVESGSETLNGLTVFLSKYSTWLRTGVVPKIAGKVLGFIGGIASIVVGAVTFYDEYKTGDRAGMTIAAVSVFSGALSVAGFLICAGAASAPLGGLILMAAGAIIGIGIAIIAYIRQITTASSSLIFKAFIDKFGECKEYTEAAASRSELRKAFETVQKDRYGEHYLWDVNPEKSSDLLEFGFTVEHIAQIVDEDKVVVVDHILTVFVKTKSYRTKNKAEYYKSVAKKLDSEPQYIKNRLKVIGARWNQNLKTFTKP